VVWGSYRAFEQLGRRAQHQPRHEIHRPPTASTPWIQAQPIPGLQPEHLKPADQHVAKQLRNVRPTREQGAATDSGVRFSLSAFLCRAMRTCMGDSITESPACCNARHLLGDLRSPGSHRRLMHSHCIGLGLVPRTLTSPFQLVSRDLIYRAS